MHFFSSYFCSRSPILLYTYMCFGVRGPGSLSHSNNTQSSEYVSLQKLEKRVLQYFLSHLFYLPFCVSFNFSLSLSLNLSPSYDSKHCPFRQRDVYCVRYSLKQSCGGKLVIQNFGKCIKPVLMKVTFSPRKYLSNICQNNAL